MTKILAAKGAVNNGITVNIISGKKSGLIVSLLKAIITELNLNLSERDFLLGRAG